LQLERLVADIEQEIYACGDQEIPTARIGDMIMTRLPQLSEVAYVRFASVYRRFKDIAGFERELIRIREKKLDDIEKRA
jgi:transcriptional repressor NrdR